jgi:hypothetical protein
MLLRFAFLAYVLRNPPQSLPVLVDRSCANVPDQKVWAEYEGYAGRLDCAQARVVVRVKPVEELRLVLYRARIFFLLETVIQCKFTSRPNDDAEVVCDSFTDGL